MRVENNLSMVLATIVEDLLSDQNLIGVSPRSTGFGGYTLIVGAMAIVGWSAVRNLADLLPQLLLIQGTSGSAARSPTIVRNDHLLFPISRRHGRLRLQSWSALGAAGLPPNTYLCNRA
jgi:hypothetical protein